ncbi:MAG: LytR/AlgR family response regulator transcription factor [Methylophilaceae bacterium]
MEAGMTGLNVLVVDDEPLARRRLIRLLCKLDWVERIDEAADVIEACCKTAEVQPDILLLDIQMPGGSGFDVLEKLGPAPPIVVFVTAFDHHALRAFEANAVDYVTKPIEPGRFSLAMERARVAAVSSHQTDRIAELQETVASLKHALSGQPRKTSEFWVKVRGEYVRIVAENIIRFQAERDYVRIHVAGANYLYQESLSSLERRLDPADFMRIHRSTIVRRSMIARIKQAHFAALIAVLADGSEARVGRTYGSVIRASLKASGFTHGNSEGT